LSTYLSSFGQSSSPTEADHEIFKRSPKRKMRKGAKKASQTTTETTIDDDDAEIITGKPSKQEIPEKPQDIHVQQSYRERKEIVPGEMFKFEIDDAAYSEEYEKFRQSKNRRLRSARSHSRVKRSTDDIKNDEKIDETKQTKDSFRQPKEFLKFLISDAVTTVPPETKTTQEKKESSEKKKRETTDQATADTIKNVQLNNPLRDRHVTKHVAYDGMSPKLKSMIDSALADAIQRKAASENDYLKFFYGDKIIKVPMSLSRHIKLNLKDSSSKGIETPTKTPYYPMKAPYKYEKPIYHTTSLPQLSSHTSSGKAESYANFKTPISPIIIGKPIVSEINIPELVTETPTSIDPSYKKSVYFYSSEHEDVIKSSTPPTTSPGPVLFTTPSSIPSLGDYKTRVNYSPSHTEVKFVKQEYPTHTEAKFLKDSIPINEHIDETYSGYNPPPSPLLHHNHHVIPPYENLQKHPISVVAPSYHHAPAPTPIAPSPYTQSDYSGNYDGHYEKNYEFGYVNNNLDPAKKQKKKRKKLKRKLR
jgi:hypothetical protein